MVTVATSDAEPPGVPETNESATGMGYRPESPSPDGWKRDHEESFHSRSTHETNSEMGTDVTPPVIDVLHPPSASNAFTEAPAQRKRRVSTDSEVSNVPKANPIVQCITKPGNHTKKPQMKYDPDVPMTKEEAAVWRREQRRKRNRDSAAASRQRQRDRIAELEIEVEQWKVKHDRMLRQFRELEQYAGARPPHSPVITASHIFRRRAPPPPMRMSVMPPQGDGMMHGATTPPLYPSKAAAVISPMAAAHPPVRNPRSDAMYRRSAGFVSPYASPPPHDDSRSDGQEGHIIEYHKPGKRQEHQHSSKSSSRPAVSRITYKITQ